MQSYTKRLMHLEFNLPVLSNLMNDFGVLTSLNLTDMWSIDDPIHLSIMSRPVFALILVLSTSDEYERH